MTYVAPVGLDCSRETYRTVLRLNRVKTRPTEVPGASGRPDGTFHFMAT